MTGRPPPFRSPTGIWTPRFPPSPPPRRSCPLRRARATPQRAPPRPGRRRRATAAPCPGSYCSVNCCGKRLHSSFASCRRRYEPEARPALAERKGPALTFVRGAAEHGRSRTPGGKNDVWRLPRRHKCRRAPTPRQLTRRHRPCRSRDFSSGNVEHQQAGLTKVLLVDSIVHPSTHDPADIRSSPSPAAPPLRVTETSDPGRVPESGREAANQSPSRIVVTPSSGDG